jgi:hypothetical protein
MAKRNKTSIVRSRAVQAEVLPPDRGQKAAEFKRIVAQFIEREVAEAMSGSDALFQPFFQTPEIAREIKRRQTVVEQNKYTYAYEEWGCLVCGDRERGHKSLSMCQRCFERTAHRLRSGMRKHAPVADTNQLNFMDSVRLAREALAPSVEALAVQNAKGRRRK